MLINRIACVRHAYLYSLLVDGDRALSRPADHSMCRWRTPRSFAWALRIGLLKWSPATSRRQALRSNPSERAPPTNASSNATNLDRELTDRKVPTPPTPSRASSQPSPSFHPRAGSRRGRGSPEVADHQWPYTSFAHPPNSRGQRL